MPTRRRFLKSAALGGLALPAAARLSLAQDDRSDAEVTIDRGAQDAIDKGLAFLSGSQHADGSFGSSGYRRNVAVCALAGMAFMSAGSTPDRGMYGDVVSRTLDFLLANTQDSGFILVEEAASHGPMYGHGFATLFLAECYGMTMREDIREKLGKAVQLIIDTQNEEGGWRYQPQRRDADISVTVCQMMALRAARNAGLYVPAEVRDRCIEYVKRSQNADGGFMYMLQGGQQSAFPRSAAGVVALYSAGYDGKEVEKGLEFLERFLPSGSGFQRESHYFYGHYYAVQAMWHAGGVRWGRWYPAISAELLDHQNRDGSWTDSVCDEYGAAMACVVLQMPNNFLPIFQT